MTHESSMEGTSLNQVLCDSSDSTIEINIKTLDSQIYSFRVKKNMPVPALKEVIVSTIGVPLEHLRLIYRGKVLKDDQLLSDHSVEDGDTLHLVVRPEAQSQPTSSTAASNTSRTSSQANDSGSGLQHHARVGQVAHSVFLGTVNIGDRHGEAMPVDLSQIVPAVLNLLGAQNIGATGGPSLAPILSTANQAYSVPGTQSSLNQSRTQAVNSASGGFVFPNQQVPLSSQFLPTPSRGTVIVDALTTLSEFIDRMQGVLQSNNNSANNGQHQRHSAASSLDSRGLPTPEFLCSVLEQTLLLLRDNAAAALLHVSTRLQIEGSSSDPLMRAQIQTEAMQLGLAMQHLGAMLLELGRVAMTLRMGQTPAESSVYAGPAVYISSAGPNPIMVQPFPFQASSLFGMSGPPSTPDLAGRGASGDPSSNINIHLHSGGSVPHGASSNGNVVSSYEVSHAHVNAEQTADRSDSISTGGLPSRTVAAALQARSVPEASGQVLGVVYPVHVRTQQPVPIRSAAQVFSTTASRGGQPHEQNLVPLPPLGSDSFPVLVAEVTAHIPMVPSENTPVQSSSLQSSATDVSHGAVNSEIPSMANLTSQPPEVYNGIMHTTQLNGVRRNALCSDSQSQNVSSRPETSSLDDLPTGHDEHVGLEEQIGAEVSISEEPLAINLTSTPASCQFGSIPSCSSDVNSFKSEPDSFESPPSNTTTQRQPLGLGAGSLRTNKKRNKTVIKSKGTGDGQANPSSSDQLSFSRGSEAFHSLPSQTSHVDGENANESSSQFPSLISQIMNNMSLEGQAGSGQTDFTGMMANAMQSSGFSNLLSGVASHARVPTGDLRSMLEQCVQNPAVQSTVNRLVQQAGQSGDQVSNVGTVQGGFDFKGMIQQLLPAVSQALGSSSASSAAVTDIKSEPQSEPKNVQTSAVKSLSESDYQVDFSQALERIEQNDDPRNIFGSLLSISRRLFGEQTTHQDIAELGNDEELAREFVEVLKQDIRRRLAEESTPRDES